MYLRERFVTETLFFYAINPRQNTKTITRASLITIHFSLLTSHSLHHFSLFASHYPLITHIIDKKAK